VKPDNILVNWEETKLPNGMVGPPKLGKVIVSDLDSSLQMRGWSVYPTEEFRHVRFGNIRWRAPEMQTRQGIGLFSDVFALALVVGDVSHDIPASKWVL
jgi:serine/threonine protein kinase